LDAATLSPVDHDRAETSLSPGPIDQGAHLPPGTQFSRGANPTPRG